jgi:ABC-type multidrug transport system fused ATPase/permease subunit
MLLRLYEPASGDVTLDGTSLSALDVGWLRRRIGSVAQEPALLSGTVRDIIRYADPDASQACALCTGHVDYAIGCFHGSVHSDKEGGC